MWYLHPIFKPHRGVFCMNARPHHRALAAFPKQNEKCPGGWAPLESTEPLALRNKLYIIFSLDKIREQMRSEMENISEKITEEGGQFGLLIPNSVSWTSFSSDYYVLP